MKSHVRAVYEAWDVPLYPDVQKEIAIKLLALRQEFKQNCTPLDASATHKNAELLSSFKVPFRLPSKKQDDLGSVILLQGKRNMNKDTNQWFGFQGYVARLLNRESASKANIFAKRKQLESRLKTYTIDVEEWKTLSEV